MDHIFKNCEHATYVCILDNNCPNPIHTKMGIVDWFGYL